MSTLVAEGAALRPAIAPLQKAANAELIARLERLPVTPRLMLLRVIVGIATFFDGDTVLAIAFAMPVLASEWRLSSSEVGLILSAGYVGQLFGAVLFGSLAERAFGASQATSIEVCSGCLGTSSGSASIGVRQFLMKSRDALYGNAARAGSIATSRLNVFIVVGIGCTPRARGAPDARPIPSDLPVR